MERKSVLKHNIPDSEPWERPKIGQKVPSVERKYVLKLNVNASKESKRPRIRQNIVPIKKQTIISKEKSSLANIDVLYNNKSKNPNDPHVNDNCSSNENRNKLNKIDVAGTIFDSKNQFPDEFLALRSEASTSNSGNVSFKLDKHVWELINKDWFHDNIDP